MLNGAAIQHPVTSSLTDQPPTAPNPPNAEQLPAATANDSTANTAPKPPTTDKGKGRNTSATDVEEEDFVVQDEDDNGGAIEILEPKPRKSREGQSPLERAANQLLTLTPHDLDSDWVKRWVTYLKGMQTHLHSVSMTGLQNLLIFVFSVSGPRALAQLARQAREHAATFAIHDAVLHHSGLHDPHSPYASLATSLLELNKSKVESVYAQVNLLISDVTTARVFVNFDRELQEQTSEQFAMYKATIEKKTKQYGKLGSASSRRQSAWLQYHNLPQSSSKWNLVWTDMATVTGYWKIRNLDLRR